MLCYASDWQCQHVNVTSGITEALLCTKVSLTQQSLSTADAVLPRLHVVCSVETRCCSICLGSASLTDEGPGLPSSSAHVCGSWCLQRLQGHYVGT